MEANTKMRDMTQGSPAKHIFLFSLPLLLGNVLQQLYNMVDSWTVGNFTGDTALAAVGIAFRWCFCFVSLFIGLGIGSTVVIAQFYGAGETERVRAAIDTAYAAFLIVAIPISRLLFFPDGSDSLSAAGRGSGAPRKPGCICRLSAWVWWAASATIPTRVSCRGWATAKRP